MDAPIRNKTTAGPSAFSSPDPLLAIVSGPSTATDAIPNLRTEKKRDETVVAETSLTADVKEGSILARLRRAVNFVSKVISPANSTEDQTPTAESVLAASGSKDTGTTSESARKVRASTFKSSRGPTRIVSRRSSRKHGQEPVLVEEHLHPLAMRAREFMDPATGKQDVLKGWVALCVSEGLKVRYESVRRHAKGKGTPMVWDEKVMVQGFGEGEGRWKNRYGARSRAVMTLVSSWVNLE